MLQRRKEQFPERNRTERERKVYGNWKAESRNPESFPGLAGATAITGKSCFAKTSNAQGYVLHHSTFPNFTQRC
jgi:hypothetical protein